MKRSPRPRTLFIVGWLIVGWLLLAATGLSGCSPGLTTHAAPFIDLQERTPLPVAAPAEVAHLRMGVAAILSPQGTMTSYSALAEYLSRKLGRPVDLVQRRTYAEFNELVERGEVELAFICTNSYVVGAEKFGMELLLAPEIGGESVYYSQLIVPANSPAQTMADLRGKVFAFTDPMSFTGHIYPTYLVQQLGETPETFFRRTFYTYSHDRAIEAVANGVADGAAVDSLVLDYALQREPGMSERLRIIHKSEAFGIPPVVVPPTLPPRQKALLRELLLTMHEEAEGQIVLRNLGVDRFIEIEDAAYDGVRRLVQATGIR
ncbi:substrate-binding domain-containing protein [Caldilinea sp.]|jgi:phosphonate transport system substrate-binding protein|uniref:substrate-binding domain-containing protein n=1 Tax=Caldilinea sp. TaxID=2293560 RepID=UPI0021DBC2FB|nr:phosphate/phosphite/phosphonate ABC transporter substrate-binding protein [Caldilinea sp.]GIV67146.1 MAG: phosphonate ABC transporter substrate-binding protein [Caldilinea sp.]GIV71419.1 MAG: phosphonate ABC transporter substrate-binding protein [Caldilinea sp.]